MPFPNIQFGPVAGTPLTLLGIGDPANPNDPAQQAKWAGEKAAAVSKNLMDRANYLTSGQRRNENVAYFSGLANRMAGGTEDYMADMASKGLLGASSLVSKFAMAQERDRAGKAFVAAGQQSMQDEREAGGLLQAAGNMNLQQQDMYNKQWQWQEQMKQQGTDFWDVLGQIGGTALGAVTGGASMALGSWGKGLLTNLLGGGGSPSASMWKDTGMKLGPATYGGGPYNPTFGSYKDITG